MSNKIPKDVRNFIIATPWVINTTTQNKTATAVFSLSTQSSQSADKRRTHYEQLVKFFHQFGVIANIESPQHGITIDCKELERHMPGWLRDFQKHNVEQAQLHLFEDTNKRMKQGDLWVPIKGLMVHDEALSQIRCENALDADALKLNLGAAHIPVVKEYTATAENTKQLEDNRKPGIYILVPAKKLREIGIYDESVTSAEMERGHLPDDPFIEARRQFFAQPWKKLTDTPEYYELTVPDAKTAEINKILETLNINTSDIVPNNNGYTYYYVTEDMINQSLNHFPPSPNSAPTGRDITPPNEKRKGL